MHLVLRDLDPELVLGAGIGKVDPFVCCEQMKRAMQEVMPEVLQNATVHLTAPDGETGCYALPLQSI
jgi:hypothetical protein